MLQNLSLPFGKKIKQIRGGQSVTTDTESLVKYIQSKSFPPNLKVLDIGSGNGIISIMLADSFPEWNITGIDIQPELVELSQNNAELCSFKIDFKLADLRNYESDSKFDLIVSNPPFYKKDQGRISPDKIRAISRHELECTMNFLLNCLKINLAVDGSAILIYPLERWDELLFNLKKVDLQIAEKFILNKQNIERFLVELKKC